MPIATGDILYKFSVTTGAAGNSVAGNAAGSLGKYVSTTQITDAVLDNLFDNVAPAENTASNVDYKCFFVHNNHATLTLLSAVVWVSDEVASGAAIAIAVDNIGPVDVNQASAQAAQIANEDTAPTGVGAFSTPTSKVTGLALGDIGPGQVRAIWVRRTAANTAAVTSDGGTIRVEGGD